MVTNTGSRPSVLAATLSILYCRHAFATLVTVDDRDSSLVWGGSWEPFSGQPEAEDGTLTWANSTGPTVTFTFTGKLPIVLFLLIHLARGLTALNEPAAARRRRASVRGVQAGRDMEHPVAVRGRRWKSDAVRPVSAGGPGVFPADVLRFRAASLGRTYPQNHESGRAALAGLLRV